MPELKASIPHQLPKNDALQKIKTLLEKMKAEHADKISNLHQDWQGYTGLFSFLVMGFAVSGTLTVEENSVELVSDIPLPALLFKSKIKSMIEEEGARLLT